MRDTNTADGAASQLTIASESVSGSRTKRNAHDGDDDDESSVNQQQHQHYQRQRKIKKFIRKIGNNPNNTLSNTSDTNDKLNFKRSNNRSDNDNTQEINGGSGLNGEHVETIASSTSPTPSRFRPSKRRIVVPIRRNRVNHTLSTPPPSTTPNPIELTDLTNSNHGSDHVAVKKPVTVLSSEQKKKLYVKRRRITPKPFNALVEPSSSEFETLSTSLELTTPSLLQAPSAPSLSSSSSSAASQQQENLNRPTNNADAIEPEISLEIVTSLTTIPKTYTYVVTRVHDQQSEIISSTFVRDQTKTLTDTITHTIYKTEAADAATIQPTETLKFARTLFA